MDEYVCMENDGDERKCEKISLTKTISHALQYSRPGTILICIAEL